MKPPKRGLLGSSVTDKSNPPGPPASTPAQQLQTAAADSPAGLSVVPEAAPVALLPDAARALVDEVKADAAALWAKLEQLYIGSAHLALGYSSWGAFYETEFGRSGNLGYKLLKAARVRGALEAVVPGSTDGMTERQARELSPLAASEQVAIAREMLEAGKPLGSVGVKELREFIARRDPERTPTERAKALKMMQNVRAAEHMIVGIAVRAEDLTDLLFLDSERTILTDHNLDAPAGSIEEVAAGMDAGKRLEYAQLLKDSARALRSLARVIEPELSELDVKVLDMTDAVTDGPCRGGDAA